MGPLEIEPQWLINTLALSTSCVFLQHIPPPDGLITVYENRTGTGTGTKSKVQYAVEMFTLV